MEPIIQDIPADVQTATEPTTRTDAPAALPSTGTSTPTAIAAATSTALVSTYVDEHTPIVMRARMQPPGSTLYLEAGAGSGKTTFAESVLHVSKTNMRGEFVQRLATTMTKAGVNELKGKPNIPDGIVKSLHSLGYHAICSTYKRRMHASVKRLGIVLEGEAKEIRMPTPHATKYKLMAQTLLPATELDKEPHMHVAGRVSAAYALFVHFVEELATKAMEGGLGQPDNPEVSDLKELQRLVDRYELGQAIERCYNDMSLELRLLADRSVAVIQRFGAEALSEPVAAIKAMVDDLPPVACTPEDRQHAGIALTALLLGEAIKVAMRPSWRGHNVLRNALDPLDVMYLPSLMFCEMVALPANVAVQAPVLAKNGRKYDAILIDEAQDSNMAQAGLIKWAMDSHTQLIVVGDPMQRCFSFASASTDALRALIAPRELGVVDRRVLTNCFRCARLICKEVQAVLVEMQSDRIVRPVRPDDGEVIKHASLRRGELQAWMAEGTVAILARLNSVLACFTAHFLKVGQPFALLGQQGVLPQLIRLLDTFEDDATLATMLLKLRSLVASDNRLSLEEKDIAMCLHIFASSLLPDASRDVYSKAVSAKRRLAQLLEKAFKGSSNATGNATVRGMPILANGHAAKGHEFHTVVIAEPSLMTIQKIIDGGGEEAEDEMHLKYVFVSRAKDRLVFLIDTFKKHGAPGITDLCTPRP